MDTQANTILLVDDDGPLRSIIQRLLKNTGYKVISADSGEEGLKLYNEHHREIVFVVTDCDMATEVDGKPEGIRLVENIRAKDLEVPIVIMSGRLHNINDLPGGECNHFLAKPFKVKLLKKLLEDTTPDTLSPPSQGPSLF